MWNLRTKTHQLRDMRAMSGVEKKEQRKIHKKEKHTREREGIAELL
jgi:hypothetical protein